MLKEQRFWEGQRWAVLPTSSFAIQHIVLHACALMTVLVRESEEGLFRRLGCKLEDKSKLDCTTVGKEGMDQVHRDKVRDSTEHYEPSRS
jgi:hypothetical protein